jgi:hypothetical protein
MDKNKGPDKEKTQAWEKGENETERSETEEVDGNTERGRKKERMEKKKMRCRNQWGRKKRGCN